MVVSLAGSYSNRNAHSPCESLRLPPTESTICRFTPRRSTQMAQPAIADPGNAWSQAFLHLREHGIDKRADMSWHDYLLALLRVGASLEHALMVQYLYAAYSLGGPQVPEKYRPMVVGWQETLLTV